jgi:uncharacterized membrane protein
MPPLTAAFARFRWVKGAACFGACALSTPAFAQLTIYEPPTPTAQLVVTGVSFDGYTVGGYWREPSTTQTGSFVTQYGQITYFGSLPLAQRLSGDGNILVGNAGASLWWADTRSPTPLIIQPTVTDGALLVGGLSFDGSALAVLQFAPRVTLRGNAHVYRVGQGFSNAFCPEFATLNFSNVVLAGDGQTLAADGANEQGSVAFVKLANGSCVPLPRPAGVAAGVNVRAISQDGTTVVGQAGGFATRWRNGLPQIIPIPAVGSSPFSQLMLASGNGSLVAGFGGITRDGSNEWLFSDQRGLQRLEWVLDEWTGTVPAGRLVILGISGDGRTIAGIAYQGDGATAPARLWIAREPGCDDIDFDNDGLFPSDDDLVSFLIVLAGGDCPTAPPAGAGCDSIDFNGDGITPSDEDLIAFLTVLAGSPCPT